MVGVEEGREFRFRGDLYSQESTLPLVCDILFILQYKVSTTVMDLVVFALFVFMLALLCFCACCYRIFGRIKIYILCCI